MSKKKKKAKKTQVHTTTPVIKQADIAKSPTLAKALLFPNFVENELRKDLVCGYCDDLYD